MGLSLPRLGHSFDKSLIINSGGYRGNRATPGCLTRPLPFPLAWRKEEKIRSVPPSRKDESPAAHPAHLSPALQVRREGGYLRGDESGAVATGRVGWREGRRKGGRAGEQGGSGRCVAWRPQTLTVRLSCRAGTGMGTVPALLPPFPEGLAGMRRAWPGQGSPSSERNDPSPWGMDPLTSEKGSHSPWGKDPTHLEERTPLSSGKKSSSPWRRDPHHLQETNPGHRSQQDKI